MSSDEAKAPHMSSTGRIPVDPRVTDRRGREAGPSSDGTPAEPDPNAVRGAPSSPQPEVMGGIGSEGPYKYAYNERAKRFVVTGPHACSHLGSDNETDTDILCDDLNQAFKAGLSQREGDEEPAAWTTKLALDVMTANAGTQFGIIDATSHNLWGENGIPLYRRRQVSTGPKPSPGE